MCGQFKCGQKPSSLMEPNGYLELVQFAGDSSRAVYELPPHYQP